MAPLPVLSNLVKRIIGYAGGHRWTASLVGATALLAALTAWAVGYVEAHRPERALAAAVYPGIGFEGAPTRVTRDMSLDPATLARAAGLDPQQPFSVEWQGVILAGENGRHPVAVTVDDGVAVWIDEQHVIDSLDVPGRRRTGGVVDLDAGLHAIRVRYIQRGGETRFHLTWARPSWRENFIDPLVTPATDPPPVFRRMRKALALPAIVAAGWSGLLIVLVGAGLYRLVAWVSREPPLSALGRPSILAIGCVAVLVLSVGIDVGTSPWRAWAPDEIPPQDWLDAAQQWFSGGWHALYPPVQFYLLGLVSLPFIVGSHLQWLTLDDGSVQALLHVVGRCLTAVMAVLTLILTALIAKQAVGRRAAVLAACLFAGVPLFAFYGKTTNVDVPYLFWVAFGLLCFARCVRRRLLIDHIALGAAAALAAATKDQAYGYFPGMALVLLCLSWRDTPTGDSRLRRAWATVLDRRLWAGAVACAAVYLLAMGVPWNAGGVAAHFDLILGEQGAKPFRMFSETWTGLGHLTLVSSSVLSMTLGVVFSALGIVGLGVAVSHPRRFGPLLLLIVPALSYAITFVAVAGYVYDRFLIGVALIAALFAALGLEQSARLIASRRARPWAVSAVVGIALVPALLLNQRMVSDSRLRAERWMTEHLPGDPFVLGVGSPAYLPSLYRFQHQFERRTHPDDVLAWEPDVIVTNEDWLDRPDRTSMAAFRQGLSQAGYQELLVLRPDRVRSWWSSVVELGLTIDPLFSNLSKVDPTIVVWRRVPTTGRIP